jgi:prepilin-type N-terminal cleavage/methylation domain-containing protein
MKKAFTLIELLVVIAIIAILAALLMPALGRARREAQKSSCRNNVHNVGIGLALFTQDNNGLYPGWACRIGPVTGPGNAAYWATVKGAADTGGDWAYQLINKKYLDNVQLFHCPSVAPLTRGDWVGVKVYDFAAGFRSDPGGETFRQPGTTGSNDIGAVGFNEYEYDLGRISKDSMAGRGVYGDGWERWWNWFDDSGWWPYSHPDGGNLLYVDNAVQFAPLVDATTFPWMVYTGMGGTATPNPEYWTRNGSIPNPRMDEDSWMAKGLGVTEASLLPPQDHDDIYAVENGQNAFGWQTCGGVPRVGVGDAWNSSFIGNEPGSWGGAQRCYHVWNSSNGRGFFPEVASFANESRWDKYDTNLVPGPMLQPGPY